MGNTGIYGIMTAFRKFLRDHDVSFSLREQEAAPPSGVGSPPTDPQSDSGYENVPNSMAREFNVPEKALRAALETGTLTLQQLPQNIQEKWGFYVRPPIDVSVEEIGNELWNVSFPLRMLYASNPQIFYYQDEKGNTYQYNGPVEDQTIQLSTNSLMQAWQGKAFAGAGGGGGMPPMGGAPPMMGGAPPMMGGGM